LPQIVGFGTSGSAFGPPARVQQWLWYKINGASFSMAPYSAFISSFKNKTIFFRRLLLGWVSFENLDASTFHVTSVGENQAPELNWTELILSQ
jgi:hypothetical protein